MPNYKSIENKLPVAREGLPFILPPLAVGLIILAVGLGLLSVVFFALALFSIWFFRDPERQAPEDEKAVVSPADGRIIIIEEVNDQRFLNASAKKISIFMSVLNVHVNRTPLTGTAEDVKYHPGKFFNADLDKASQENEHNAVILKTEDGVKIAFVQIAGIIARRIVCWISAGDNLVRGKRFGLIRFGSRLDVFLPPETEIKVVLGQKVKAGETIIGCLK